MYCLLTHSARNEQIIVHRDRLRKQTSVCLSVKPSTISSEHVPDRLNFVRCGTTFGLLQHIWRRSLVCSDAQVFVFRITKRQTSCCGKRICRQANRNCQGF